VLDHLARVGVYERGGGASPAWVTPARQRSRGTWVFAIAIVLAAAAGYGAFAYARKVRDGRMATARSLEAETLKLLSTGSTDDLKKTDDKLSAVFDLDSRSEKAALLWLENRVLTALLVPGETRGIEAAMSRCRTLNIDEFRTAFGKIASFMVEGDLAGAAAILPKWDEKAKGDALYQLAAGALLERAGDVRAIGRYEQAFKLDPNLVLARVFHAQLVALELGYEAGKPALDEAIKQLGERPMARALEGLAWMTGNAEGELPASAVVPPQERAKLPSQLLSIPHVVDARVHALAGRTAEAIAALDDALRVSATPSMASWIGQVAIDLGDEKLARSATLRALSFSALYPRARSLAARVALLGGRIDEAKSAIQELDASSKEVAVVRAAAAYEALDLSELDGAATQIGSPDGAARALAAGVGISLGKKYPLPAALEQFASPSVPWGDLIAVDAALDLGNLELARKISARWGERSSTPAYALRRARLARYDGKAEDAVKASEEALVAGGVTPRVLIERVLALLAAKDAQGARAVVSQYPVVLGPMTKLLSIIVNAEGGKLSLAKSDAATVEPPPDGSPVLYELLAARALLAVDDRRGKVLIAGLSRRLPKHPDVVAMLQALAAG
jgi:tetratricopeptide (TPR) repeat protein